MKLSNEERKKFRAIGHKLKPIVMIAQKGLTENIGKELNRALEDHELIKVKIAVGDRKDKTLIASEISSQYNAECVQSIGGILLLYRAAKKQDPKLSNLKRRLN